MTNKNLPPYRRIAEDLRTQITSGALRSGEKVRSENELKDEYGTTRVTVRKALALLKAEGLISSEQGRGAFVRPRPKVHMLTTGANFRAHRDSGVANFNAEANSQNLRPEQRILAVGRVPAPDEVAERLGLAPDADVIVRRRLFLADGQPMQLADGYYPVSLFSGTRVEDPQRISGGVSHLIEDPAGPVRRRITRFVEDLDIRMPSTGEAESLSIPPGVPLARILRTAFTATGESVEVLDSRVPCDRYAFRYVIDVP
jgi:GntR family transcriptional regulator